MQKGKIIVAAILGVMVYNIILGGVRAWAEPYEEISAKSAVVMYADGSCVFEKNADERMLIASTTKLMTALVAIENCPLDKQIEVGAQCCGIEGSSMYLRPGQKLSAEELIDGLLLSSGNDAAEALAVGICGDEQSFVALMNEKAAELGLNDTSFANPHGLDAEGHYSSARDLARLMISCMENAELARIIAMRSCTVDGNNYVNHNKLLNSCPGCIGGKTGYTRAAGRCLVSCCERDGTRFVCVTLSDPDDWNDHVRLYEAAFAAWSNRLVVSTGDTRKIPVVGGEESSALAVPEREVRIFMPNDETPEIICEMPRFAYAPVLSGECAGRLVILRGGEAAAEVRLIYGESVQRAGKSAMILNYTE